MHTSVLLQEAIEGLHIKEDGIYVDCTLGYAGHSSEILKRIKKGFLFAFDQDEDAITYSEEKLRAIGSNFEIIHSNFKNLKQELEKRGVCHVDGILYDLGVSSPQLDQKERGFSYHQDAPLDMRMDQHQNISAYDVVNTYSYQELKRIFQEYGEEKYAGSIARNIEKYRMTKPIETTFELVDIIKASMPERAKREKHPARKVFQAIRIEVNQELEVLKESLKDALTLLEKEGRLCVITFHSLEDRIVKTQFKEITELDPMVRGLPQIPKEFEKQYLNLGKRVPSKIELEQNNRARSAVLRIVERVNKNDKS